eukprot:GDKI01035957.1.p1 GENE.GDKI01035957.1~~GDKI01035957.1.p1  ORF type:complete len:124 (-),score=19.53 GDKI01035957.1:46-417(-)
MGDMNESPAKTYREHLSEPWFSVVKSGKKTSEGRLDKGVFAEMQPGDRIDFWHETSGEFSVEVVSKQKYSSFYTMLEGETLGKTLPVEHIRTLEEGVNVYYGFYKQEDEQRMGVVAVRVKRVE